MKKVVYITGCLGFIGYHVSKACLDKGWYVKGIDKCTYAANVNLLDDLQKYANFSFEKEDICNISYLRECDIVINTAAETHVDNSIASSDVFLNSNVYGVYNLLEVIRRKHKFSMPLLFHFSTDEVYGDILNGSHQEGDLLKPSNPYSATKASADMLIMAWARTYNVPYIILRPTNNYGIGQYVEKFIPHTIKYLSLGKKAPLHDSGLPKRTWLHARDTANAVTLLVEKNISNEIFNVSGNLELPNLEVAKKILLCMNLQGDYEQYLDLSVKRAGQDVRYSIDDSKLKKLGWIPKSQFDVELQRIVDYYTKNFFW